MKKAQLKSASESTPAIFSETSARDSVAIATDTGITGPNASTIDAAANVDKRAIMRSIRKALRTNPPNGKATYAPMTSNAPDVEAPTGATQRTAQETSIGRTCSKEEENSEAVSKAPQTIKVTIKVIIQIRHPKRTGEHNKTR